jgi:hypothetical protein
MVTVVFFPTTGVMVVELVPDGVVVVVPDGLVVFVPGLVVVVVFAVCTGAVEFALKNCSAIILLLWYFCLAAYSGHSHFSMHDSDG